MPSSSAGQLEQSRSRDLRVKLTWLTVFRTVATSLSLMAIVARLLARPVESELSRADSLSFVLIAVVFGLTLFYGLALRGGMAGQRAAYIQVLGDVLIATCLVYLTGGAESPFTFTFSIAVVAGSLLLHQRGALVAALGSAGAFVALAVLIQLGWLSPPMGLPRPSIARLVFLLSSNVIAQFLIAVLASYVARQLAGMGGQLSEREADIRELVSLQNQIVAAMPSGLITCEADGRITFVNPAAATILGLGVAGDRARDIEGLIPGVLGLRQGARRAELSVETPMGRRALGLAVTSLKGSTGSLLIVFQDLTELRRIEDDLKRADHLASLGRLSAQLAHEIRNPLASMRGSAQMLGSEAPRDSAAQRLTGILIREADRLSTLVEDFLRFARPPPPARNLVDLKRLVEETVEMFHTDPLSAGVPLQVEAPQVSAHIDGAQIRQVLLNLLRNAFQAAREASGQVRVTVFRKGEAAVLSVWDSAGSIAAGNFSQIFDPFFSTREGGTGLGLSTAHSIVAAHGGQITVTSSPGAGTEFVVTIPSAAEGAA